MEVGQGDRCTVQRKGIQLTHWLTREPAAMGWAEFAAHQGCPSILDVGCPARILHLPWLVMFGHHTSHTTQTSWLSSGPREPRHRRAPRTSGGVAPSEPGAPDVVLDPGCALGLANRAAQRALSRICPASASAAARDIAADALALLLEKRKSLVRRTILATIKHLVRRHASRLVAGLQLRRTQEPSEEEEKAAVSPTLDDPEAHEPTPAQPLSRTFADGSTARLGEVTWTERLDGSVCEADIDDLMLRRPDGSILYGRAALHAAHQLLLEERRGSARQNQAGNVGRAIAALRRDALLLSVVGLPWQEALARLRAAGVHITRDGLRSGQRAARLRCMGLAAHNTVAARTPHTGGKYIRERQASAVTPLMPPPGGSYPG